MVETNFKDGFVQLYLEDELIREDAEISGAAVPTAAGSSSISVRGLTTETLPPHDATVSRTASHRFFFMSKRFDLFLRSYELFVLPLQG